MEANSSPLKNFSAVKPSYSFVKLCRLRSTGKDKYRKAVHLQQSRPGMYRPVGADLRGFSFCPNIL